MDDLNLNTYTSPGSQNPALSPENFVAPSLPEIEDDGEIIQDVLTDAKEIVNTPFPKVDYSDKIPNLPSTPDSVIQGSTQETPPSPSDISPSNSSPSEKTHDVVTQGANIKIEGPVSPKVANQQSLLAFLSSISESIRNLEETIAHVESQGIINSRTRTLMFLKIGAADVDITQLSLVKSQLEALKNTGMQETPNGPRLNLAEHPDIMLQLVKFGCLPPSQEGGLGDGSAKADALAGTPPYDNPAYAEMALSQPSGWEELSAKEVDQAIVKIDAKIALQNMRLGIGSWALGQTMGALLPTMTSLTLADPQLSNMLMLRSQLASLFNNIQNTRLGPRIILGNNPGLMFQLKMYGIIPPTISRGEFDGMAKRLAANQTFPYNNPLYAKMAQDLPEGWEELSVGELQNVISNLDFAVADRADAIAIGLSLASANVNPLMLAASLNMTRGFEPVNQLFLNRSINATMNAVDNLRIPWGAKQQIKKALISLITMQVFSGAINNQVYAKLNEDGVMVRSPFLMNHLSSALNNFISQRTASQLISTLGFMNIGGQLNNYQLRSIQNAIQLASLTVALNPQQQGMLNNALNLISINIPLNSFQKSVLLNAVSFSVLQSPLNNDQQNILRNALNMASIGLPLNNLQRAVISEAIGYAALNTLNTFQLGVVTNALNTIAFGLPLSDVQQAVIQEALNFVALNTPLNNLQMVAIRNALNLAAIGVPLNSIQQMLVREAVGYATMSSVLSPSQRRVVANALRTINSGGRLNGYQQMRLQQALGLVGLQSPLNNYQLVAVANALSLASIGLPLNNLQQTIIREAIGYAALNSALNPLQLSVIINALDAIAFGLPLSDSQQAIVKEALDSATLGVPLNNFQMLGVRNALALAAIMSPLSNIQNQFISDVLERSFTGFTLALNVMVSLNFKADLPTIMQIIQELGLSNSNYSPIAQAALFLLTNQAFNWEAPTATKAAIDLIAPDLLVKHNSEKGLEQLEELKAMLKALKQMLAALLSGGGSPEEISKAFSQLGELMSKTGTDPALGAQVSKFC